MKNDIDYDAFVICNAEGTDLDFVNRLVDTLQAPPYKLKLCAPWRESACFNHNVREFIQYRCRKCMVVLSSNFYKSEEAVSQLQFAHSLSPGTWTEGQTDTGTNVTRNSVDSLVS
ncbi:myeloid differentiation primary response protein MyD88-B-like isoform X2 [Crassostrea virginica]